MFLFCLFVFVCQSFNIELLCLILKNPHLIWLGSGTSSCRPASQWLSHKCWLFLSRALRSLSQWSTVVTCPLELSHLSNPPIPKPGQIGLAIYFSPTYLSHRWKYPWKPAPRVVTSVSILPTGRTLRKGHPHKLPRAFPVSGLQLVPEMQAPLILLITPSPLLPPLSLHLIIIPAPFLTPSPI